RTTENRRHGNPSGFVSGQRFRPLRTILRFCSWTRAAEFKIARCLFALGTIPVVPTHGSYDVGDIGVEECHLCEVTPRPPEIRLDVRRLARNLASGNYEAIPFLRGR